MRLRRHAYFNLVEEDAAKCQAKPGVTPAEREQCIAASCDRAERSPWPAVTAERRESDDHCKQDQEMAEDYDCVLAYHDACTGLLGVVCSGRHGTAQSDHA